MQPCMLCAVHLRELTFSTYHFLSSGLAGLSSTLYSYSIKVYTFVWMGRLATIVVVFVFFCCFNFVFNEALCTCMYLGNTKAWLHLGPQLGILAHL